MSSDFTADIYACVNGGCILNYSRYDYNGDDTGVVSWKELTNSGNREWRGIDCTVIGTEIIACAFNDHIYRSNDRGKTWAPITTSIGPQAWTAINCDDTATVIVASSSCSQDSPLGGYIWISKDSGGTWQKVQDENFGSRSPLELKKYGPPYGVSNWSCITCSTNAAVIVTAELFGNVWISRDTGESWINASIESDVFPLINFTTSDVVVSDDGSVVAAISVPSKLDVGYAFVSKNYGFEWTRFPLNQRSNAITCSGDGTKLSIGTNENFIYTSLNNGFTFSQQFSSGINKWSTITISPDNKLYVAAGYWDFVYLSTDGINWTQDASSQRRAWADLTVSQSYYNRSFHPEFNRALY
jgi:photosystem II stability/assembly factor-like uncharacterized protein